MSSHKYTFVVITVAVVLISGGVFVSGDTIAGDTSQQAVSKSGSSTPTAFLREVYTKINRNFWKQIPETQLVDYFVRGTEKITNTKLSDVTNKKLFFSTLEKKVSNMTKKQRRQFPAKLADLVVTSLPPQGRSRLYTENKKQALANRVQNVNP